jgi:hypothetical protein
VVSYADLGGLGAREGTPVVHTWTPPPPPPPPPPWVAVAGLGVLRVVLPLLLLLPLFLLRANRSRQAWWVLAGVGAAALIGIALVCLLVDADRSLQRAVCALVTGLGAMWLLTPWLKSCYRVFMFLKTLLQLAGFSLLAYAATLVTGDEGWVDFWPYLAGLLGFSGLATTLSLALAGFCVRHRFGRIRFVLWLAGWLVLAWGAVITPLFIVTLGKEGPGGWEQLLIVIPVLSGFTLALLLPLVLLSFFQPFYRARFLAFLNLPQPGAAAGTRVPPVLAEVAKAEDSQASLPTH